MEADLFESGKVDPKSAYYVALSAAAEMGSVYMMARFLKLYYKSGGEKHWLDTQGPPPKLATLARINRMMARAPWDIGTDIV